MKFVRYRAADHSGYGVLEEDLVRALKGSIYAEHEETPTTYPLSDVRLLTPVEPSKIICVGLNYRGHIEELGTDPPEFPSHFLKPATAIIGPDDPILYPRIADQVDYEGELAVIIKHRVKDIPEREAMNAVLGHTCFNDVTERPLTRVQGQLTRSKGFDSFASFGPCVATGLDPAKLKVQTFLNNELVQEGQCEEMIFSVAYLIHYLSQCMTLNPGDIISTGTPKGVGPMRPGDVVEVSIEGIGVLRNPVKAIS